MAVQTWRATEEQAGDRLDRHLAEQLDLPRNRVQGWIRDHRVRVNGRVARASTSLRAGALVECEPPDEAVSPLEPEAGELVLLAEDAHFFVLDKPADLVVHPGAGVSTGTLVHRLLALDPSIATVGSPARPGIVHRLDRDTTGAMVVARTDLGYRALARDFAERRVTKVYLAVAHGRVPEQGSWSWPIARHPRHRTRMAIDPRGRPALTEFRRLDLADEDRISLIALRLHTGRTHQIRVHLKAASHPLIGDPVYGEARWKQLGPAHRKGVRSFDRPALHAWFLGLDHPRSGDPVAVTAFPPDDMIALWRAVSGRELGAVAPPADWLARDLSPNKCR